MGCIYDTGTSAYRYGVFLFTFRWNMGLGKLGWFIRYSLRYLSSKL
jgi:hypothetical protein